MTRLVARTGGSSLLTNAIVCLLLTLISLTHIANALQASPGCTLDDTQRSTELRRCLRIGERFAGRYLSRIRRNGGANVCSNFESFHTCLKPLLSKCPAIKEELDDTWMIIYEKIECACSEGGGANLTPSRSPVCRSEIDCFEKEYDGILTRRCDDVHRFNKKQRTRHACTFIHENIHCKEALVTSSCGAEAGTFAFEMFRAENRKTMQRNKCVLTKDIEYEGFRYSERCPANYTDNLQVCLNENLHHRKLEFYQNFDLIVKGPNSTIEQSCRDYKNFKVCFRPTKKSCIRGVRLVYDYEADLRKYDMKLGYICQDYEEYTRHLPCFKEVLRNGTLSVCDNIWKELRQALKDVSSHEYYCRKKSSASRALQSILTRQRNCYRQVFNSSCGNKAGGMLGYLMDLAFEDPFYLGYMYVPDCHLHRQRPGIDTKYRLDVSTLKPTLLPVTTLASATLKTVVMTTNSSRIVGSGDDGKVEQKHTDLTEWTKPSDSHGDEVVVNMDYIVEPITLSERHGVSSGAKTNKNVVTTDKPYADYNNTDYETIDEIKFLLSRASSHQPIRNISFINAYVLIVVLLLIQR